MAAFSIANSRRRWRSARWCWIRLIPPIPKRLRASIDFLDALEVAVLVRVLGVVFSGHGLARRVNDALVLAPVGRLPVEGDPVCLLVVLVRGAEECEVRLAIAMPNRLRLWDLPVCQTSQQVVLGYSRVAD